MDPGGVDPAALPQAPPPSVITSPAPAEEAKRPRSRRKTETALVAIAWLAATAFAAEGAWEFFGEVLHLPVPMLLAGFLLFEVSAVACAVMARRRRIDDVDSRWGGAPGGAVWVFGALSGFMSSSHEDAPMAKVVRFAAPLMAAFLLDLLFSGEQGDARERRGKKRKRINFKFGPERIMVRLGLADASDRSAEEAARDKAIAKVATLCHRAQLAKPGKLVDRRARAERAYRRALEAANERFGLSRDERLMAQLRTSIALLDGAMSMTSREAIAASSNPWVAAPPRRPSVPSARPASSTTSDRTTSRVTTRTVSPASGGERRRRDPEELLREYDGVVAQYPGLTQEQYCEAINISPRRMREVLATAGRTAPATASG